MLIFQEQSIIKMSPGVNEEKQCPYQITDLKFQSEKKNQISTLISAAI